MKLGSEAAKVACPYLHGFGSKPNGRLVHVVLLRVSETLVEGLFDRLNGRVGAVFDLDLGKENEQESARGRECRSRTLISSRAMGFLMTR